MVARTAIVLSSFNCPSFCPACGAVPNDTLTQVDQSVLQPANGQAPWGPEPPTTKIPKASLNLSRTFFLSCTSQAEIGVSKNPGYQ